MTTPSEVAALPAEAAPNRAADGAVGPRPSLLVIDNYDSFTYNLVHFFGELGADCHVYRNDEITVDAAMAMDVDAIVLSPGPCTPNEAGICLDLIAAAIGKRPLLGVCLGHQAIGQVFGGTIGQAPEIMHGKLSAVHHDGTGILAALPQPFQATRYHSLVIEPAHFPSDVLEITAQTDSGVIMAVQHRTLPIHGVQFHPESIATEHGHALLKGFLDLVTRRNDSDA